MNSSDLREQIDKIIQSIDLLYKQKYITPSLILTYSLIDILSWLNRPSSHPDVRQKDFLCWVDTYIRPGSTLNCTSIDLYGARCSIIHSLNSVSRLSRNHEAREIYYVWGNRDKAKLEFEIDQSKRAGEIIVLRVEDLNKALIDASNEFLKYIEKFELPLERAGQFFINISNI